MTTYTQNLYLSKTISELLGSMETIRTTPGLIKKISNFNSVGGLLLDDHVLPRYVTNSLPSYISHSIMYEYYDDGLTLYINFGECSEDEFENKFGSSVLKYWDGQSVRFDTEITKDSIFKVTSKTTTTASITTNTRDVVPGTILGSPYIRIWRVDASDKYVMVHNAGVAIAELSYNDSSGGGSVDPGTIEPGGGLVINDDGKIELEQGIVFDGGSAIKE